MARKKMSRERLVLWLIGYLWITYAGVTASGPEAWIAWLIGGAASLIASALWRSEIDPAAPKE